MPKMVGKKFSKSNLTIENLTKYLEGMPERIGFGGETVVYDDVPLKGYEGYPILLSSLRSGVSFKIRAAKFMILPRMQDLVNEYLNGEDNLSRPCVPGSAGCQENYLTNKTIFNFRRLKNIEYDPRLCQRRVEVVSRKFSNVCVCAYPLLEVSWVRSYFMYSEIRIMHNEDSEEGPKLAKLALDDIRTNTKFLGEPQSKKPLIE